MKQSRNANIEYKAQKGQAYVPDMIWDNRGKQCASWVNTTSSVERAMASVPMNPAKRKASTLIESSEDFNLRLEWNQWKPIWPESIITRGRSARKLVLRKSGECDRRMPQDWASEARWTIYLLSIALACPYILAFFTDKAFSHPSLLTASGIRDFFFWNHNIQGRQHDCYVL